MPEFSVVGQRVPRVDAPGKVTGAAVYSGDVNLAGMLHGKILRSPYAHARIKRLDVAKASQLPGVMCIITAADVPGYKKRHPLLMSRIPHLAQEKVVYPGQPVAAVAATTIQIAEKAVRLIDVEYEVLTPVTDVFTAMKPGTPPIHPDLYTNIIVNPPPDSKEKPGNVAWRVVHERGDIAAGFKEADVVFEKTYRTQKAHQGFLEPFAAVVSAEPGGKINVWTQTQGYFAARQMIADFLDIPQYRLKIFPMELGGGFGGKTYQPVSPLCALMSLKTGRPVRMEMSRKETMEDCRPAANSEITIKIGAAKDGRLTSAWASLIYDAGAYPEMSHATFVSGNAFNQYKIPNLKVEAVDIITNKVPSAFYRAPATPQIAFAIETVLDMLAEKLRIDPLQLRIMNSSAEGDPLTDGGKLTKVGFKETLEKLAGYLNTKGPLTGKYRGRGIASGFWHGGAGGFGCDITLSSDGAVGVLMGVADVSGVRTSLAQVAAEELCLPMEKVTLMSGDTDVAPYAGVSVASMTLYSASTAVFNACQDIKSQLTKIAANRLGVVPDTLEFVKGVFQVKGSTDKKISFAELARVVYAQRGEGPVIGRGTSAGLPMAPTLSVHAAEVEVDPETGKVTVIGYTASQDCGKAINPTSVEGQIQGAVGQGTGWALMETSIFKDGVMQNNTLLDYRMPTATDLPMINILIVEVGSAKGLYGVRHAGESPMIPVPAAIANAIYAATGVRLYETPMTPEAILAGIKALKK